MQVRIGDVNLGHANGVVDVLHILPSLMIHGAGRCNPIGYEMRTSPCFESGVGQSCRQPRFPKGLAISFLPGDSSIISYERLELMTLTNQSDSMTHIRWPTCGLTCARFGLSRMAGSDVCADSRYSQPPSPAVLSLMQDFQSHRSHNH